jgi:hypothetical protein
MKYKIWPSWLPLDRVEDTTIKEKYLKLLFYKTTEQFEIKLGLNIPWI